MTELNKGMNLKLPDATFDLDGTVFKLTILETYTEWLARQQVFHPIPSEIVAAKQVWKKENTEKNYTKHLSLLVGFFIEQVSGKSVSQLAEAARIVAGQQRQRRWNITTAIINKLQKSHNIIAVSLMPEWLMEPFTNDLKFVALIGSTYVAHEGRFTGEAHSINKATEYLKLRDGDKSMLDVHMGDTVGDSSLFALAKRPILFNPSWTLYRQHMSSHPAMITSHKDVVTVIRKNNEVSIWGAPFDARKIIDLV